MPTETERRYAFAVATARAALEDAHKLADELQGRAIVERLPSVEDLWAGRRELIAAALVPLGYLPADSVEAAEWNR